jgi:hypothetical protein
MRFAVLGIFLFAGLCWAGNGLIVIDPFGPGVADVGPGTPDVVGDLLNYDIQSASIGLVQNDVLVNIFLNFATDNLSGFTEPFLPNNPLYPGDLLFSAPSAGANVFAFGIPVADHGYFQAGKLYAVGNGVSVANARTALGDPPAGYRPDQPVWLASSGPVAPVAMGSVAVLVLGNDGYSAPKLDVRIQFPRTDEFLAAFRTTDGVAAPVVFTYSSAICGNDVITGAWNMPAAPEPASAAFLAGGVCALAALKFRKRSRAGAA